jgi:hypothetical protein
MRARGSLGRLGLCLCASRMSFDGFLAAFGCARVPRGGFLAACFCARVPRRGCRSRLRAVADTSPGYWLTGRRCQKTLAEVVVRWSEQSRAPLGGRVRWSDQPTDPRRGSRSLVRAIAGASRGAVLAGHKLSKNLAGVSVRWSWLLRGPLGGPCSLVTNCQKTLWGESLAGRGCRQEAGGGLSTGPNCQPRAARGAAWLFGARVSLLLGECGAQVAWRGWVLGLRLKAGVLWLAGWRVAPRQATRAGAEQAAYFFASLGKQLQ